MPFLLADAGSTKTHWRLLASGEETAQNLTTSGINPYLQSEADIRAMLEAEVTPWLNKSAVQSVAFYGAGASAPEKSELMQRVLKAALGAESVTVQGDLLGAARAVCGAEAGVVCILGTGSNACFYDGKIIARQSPSLGWIAGDEGSGNYLGKMVLQHWTYGTFDEELRLSFEARFGTDRNAIIHRLYHEPYPNRYLAAMAALLAENRGHFMVENILEDGLNDFFRMHIQRLPEAWNHPVSFAGSVAHLFSDVLETICGQYEMELGNILASPMDGLERFHRQQGTLV